MTTFEISNEIKPESKCLSFYTPPNFALTPPTSIEYRLRPIDAAKNQKGWNVNHRKELTFISFGREPPVDLIISHDSVSRKHAVLQYGEGDSGPGWYLYDLGSSHGTYLNNERIPSKQYLLVDDGIPIRLGYASKYQFTLITSHLIESNDIELKTTYNVPTWRLKVPEELNYSLEIISNGVIESTICLRDFLIDDNYITIGSKPETAKIIDKDPAVSRLHAVLQFGKLGKKYGWFIYDNASTHGTKLNKARLQQRYYAKLHIGSTFMLGGSKKLYSLTGVEIEEEEKFAIKAFGITENLKSTLGNQDNKTKEYEHDPIGWLTSYFESEGQQVDYAFTPVGDSMMCSIDCGAILQSSSDDDNTVARGEGKGRDEAKRNAALLACKMVDEQEVDQIKSEFRTKQQEYEENDYYSSGEDEFYDRTGSLDVKRKMRIARYQNKYEPEILTYEVLFKQLEEAKTHLENVQKTHDRIMKESGNSRNLSNKFYVSASRQRLTKALSEVARLEPLVAATKPTAVDHLFSKSPAVTNQYEKKNKEVEKLDIMQEDQIDNVEENKEKVNEGGKEEFKTPEMHKKEEFKIPKIHKKVVVEIKADESESTRSNNTQIKEDLQKKEIPDGYGLIHRKDLQQLKNKQLLSKKRKLQQDEEEAYFDESEKKKERDTVEEVKAAPEDDAVWLPPEGQTGDGITKLNEKFAGRY